MAGFGQVLCAPDKLRGALTAAEAAEALALGVGDAGHSAVTAPVADGGEGTQAMLRSRPHAVHDVVVPDALGRPRHAELLELAGREFVVEAAQAVPLDGLSDDERDPRRTSSEGVGRLVCAALDRGARRIVVAVGGTATLDGGAGLLHALGATAARHGGDLLDDGVTADLSGLDRRLADVALTLLADVDAPLTGADGSAAVFGPQKGLDRSSVVRFEAALARWAETIGTDARRPGAGAGGGLGAALQALGAETRRGAEALLDLVGFDELLAHASLCLTAEGSVDASTLQGKAVAEVVARCVRAQVPVVVLGGRVDEAAGAALCARGAAAVRALGPSERALAVALASAAADLRAAARGELARARDEVA